MRDIKLMPILVLLIAFCGIVATVSAGLNTVPWKGTVFIGEEDLDITAAMMVGNESIVYDTLAYFGSGSDPYTDAPEATINGVTATSFYVSPATFTGKTGAWYVRDGSTTINVGLYVENPSLTVKIWNIDTAADVTGQNVPRTARIDFKIDTNLYQIRNRAPLDVFDFDIEVTNPDGTTYSSLATDAGYRDIENIGVDTSLYYWANRDTNKGWSLEATEGGNRLYESGTYKVQLDCKQNNLDVVSTERTVTIASDSLKISTATENLKITRGNSFTVKIEGQPKTDYYLFVKSTQNDPAPYIILNQKNVDRGAGGSYVTESGKTLENSVPKNEPGRYYGVVTLDSTGKLSVGFQTTKETDTKKYTIRVENKFDGSYKSDETYVTVTEGTVMIEAEGQDTFFLGDQIELTGTSSETESVYFFITGPNLPSVGGKLTDPTVAVSNGNPDTFDSVDLDENDEFAYTWNTDELGIDAGTYTVYAIVDPNDKNHLADTAYDTVSISLKKPFLAAYMENHVAAGDKLVVNGTAGTQPAEGVAVWVLGKNFVSRDIVEVNDDSNFEYEIDGGITADMATGQYYVVVQHPMYNNIFDVVRDGNLVENADGETIFKISGAGALQGSDAAYALIDAIEDANIDDQYTSLQFTVDAATITINAIPDTVPGKKITVNGETNLRAGDELLIEILSSTFTPTKKTQSGEFSGSSKSVTVKHGPVLNTFSAEFDTTGFVPDTYIIQVTGIVTPASAVRSFNMVVATPTPTPTPPPTSHPTTVVTTILTTPPPTTKTPTPTPTSPGFGAIIALIGLGCVAYLIVRKS